MHTSRESDVYIALLYEKYYKTLERMCYRFVNYNIEYSDIISDCIQDTFLVAEKEYKKFDNRASLAGWLIKTCQNRLLPKLRKEIKRKKWIAFSMDAENTPVATELIDSVDNWIRKEDAREEIDLIYQLLTDKEQKTMQSFFINGLSIDEIAQKEHTTKVAVKSTIHRIRKKQKRFKEYL